MNEIERFKRNLLLLVLKYGEDKYIKCPGVIITFMDSGYHLFNSFRVFEEYIVFYGNNFISISISENNYYTIEYVKYFLGDSKRLTLNTILEDYVKL